MRLVTFNVASVDGRIAISPSTPSWLDVRWKPLDRFETADVLSSTALACRWRAATPLPPGTPEAVFDDYTGAAAPAGDFLPPELRAHAGRWLIVIDTRARVRWTTFEMGGTRLAVLISRTTPAAYRLFLREHAVPYFEVGDARAHLGQALRRLGAVFDEECVISSGGGVLNGALLQAGLVDEVDIQFLPVIIGRADAPAIFEGYDSGSAGSLHDLRLISAENRSGGSAFARYAAR